MQVLDLLSDCLYTKHVYRVKNIIQIYIFSMASRDFFCDHVVIILAANVFSIYDY